MTTAIAAGRAGGAPASRRGHPWWTLVSVAFGLVMVGLDGTVVAIANPVIGRDLHTSLAQLQWITNAYLLVLAVGLVFGGKLGDRYGRRNLFLIGVVGFALSSLAVGLVGTTGGVIAFRALQGAFGALLMPNTLAILRATFPPAKLNMAIGIWGGASAISIAAGPIVGGLLVEHVSWQSVFYINVPIAAVAVLIGLLVLAESRDEHRPRHDFPGIVLLAGGLFALVFAFVKAETWGWGTARTIGLIVAGIVILGAFVAVERRRRMPLLPMRLFAVRSLSIATVVVLVGFFALFGVLFFLTLYLQNVHGYSAVQAGLRILPLSVTMMVSAPLGGILTQRFGARPPMVLGLLLIAGGLLWMTGLTTTSPFGDLWPPFVALGLGMGFMITSSSEAIVGNAPVEDAGVAGGIQSTATQLGGVLGTAVLGSVLSSRVGSVFVSELVKAGTPVAIATRLHVPAVTELVGQGIAPAFLLPAGGPRAAVVAGSHQAFMTGLHTALTVGAVLAVVAAAMALLVKRNSPAGDEPAEAVRELAGQPGAS